MNSHDVGRGRGGVEEHREGHPEAQRLHEHDVS
jgi:hypothetical protein